LPLLHKNCCYLLAFSFSFLLSKINFVSTAINIKYTNNGLIIKIVSSKLIPGVIKISVTKTSTIINEQSKLSLYPFFAFSIITKIVNASINSIGKNKNIKPDSAPPPKSIIKQGNELARPIKFIIIINNLISNLSMLAGNVEALAMWRYSLNVQPGTNAD
jgi:hypothetical protein